MSIERSDIPTANVVPIRTIADDRPVGPLPRLLTSFVGRMLERDAVAAMFREAGLPLVTLTGQGGVGKTRLAIAVADHLDDVFTDGIVFVSFEAVADPGQALVRIAEAACVPDAPGQSLLHRMQNHFRERNLLLVLDNLEHLPGFGRHIADLVGANPSVHILCTSRTPLHIAGEQIYPVPPLLPDEAANLFADRACAVEPAFAASAPDATLVDRVCERLECLPLAIELAAARVDVLPLPALIERLDNQLSVLTGGPHNAARRHRAMRDAIAWSFDLLNPADHVLLRRLAVCLGGFSLDAAREIANDGQDALDGIARLIAAGLVRRVPGPDGDARYRLPVSIREFAFEQLEAFGEVDMVRARHAVVYRDLSERACPRLVGPDHVAWKDRIEADLDNCRAAMAWALAENDRELAIRTAGALWRMWACAPEMGGKAWTDRVTEGLAWIERSLVHRENMPVRYVVEALVGAAEMHLILGDITTSNAYASDLLQRSRAEDFAYGEVWACLQLGEAAHFANDLDRAKHWFTLASHVVPTLPESDYFDAMILMMLGDVADATGDHGEALRLAEASLPPARRCGHPHVIATQSLVAGQRRLGQGNAQDAVCHFIESVEAAKVARDDGCIRAAITELGRVAMVLDRSDLALYLLRGVHHLLPHEQDKAVHDAAVIDLAAHLGTSVNALLAAPSVVPGIADLLDMARCLLIPEDAPGVTVHPAGLTSRELDVLHCLADGISNKAIAATLSISERTVENHVYRILDKLNLESRTAAATWAVRQGLT